MTWADEVLAGHPFVVAHRGASAARPEHTLAAYDLALKEGADGVECDVRLTRDGHLVCVHDRRLDRTSTGAGLVSTMTLAQLRELEYGAWHDSWRPDGSHGDTSLLTLDALVSLVLDWHRPVKIFVETKHPVRYGSLVENKLLAPESGRSPALHVRQVFGSLPVDRRRPTDRRRRRGRRTR